MITLYHYPLSPCSEKIRYALALKGLVWEELHLDLAAKENLAPAFLELNPQGCIPVLVNDQDVVSDSTVILEYLEAMEDAPSLTPVAAMDRVRMRMWAKHIDEVIHPAWPGIAWVVLVRPKWMELGADAVCRMVQKLPDPLRRERQLMLFEAGFSSSQSLDAINKMRSMLVDMDQELEDREFLNGNQAGLADICVLPYCTALDAFGLFQVPAFDLTPRLLRWYQQMINLPELQAVLKSQITPERANHIRSVGQEALKALA